MSFSLERAKTIYDSEEKLYQYALRILTRQMRTVAQLKRLLRAHAPNEERGREWVEAVVARLKSHGYISDKTYAEAYTHVRQTKHKLGKHRIEKELQQKGVHETIVTQATTTAFEGVSEREQIQAFLQRKRVAVPTTQKDTARVLRMLQRAGFGMGASLAYLRAWQKQATIKP